MARKTIRNILCSERVEVGLMLSEIVVDQAGGIQ